MPKIRDYDTSGFNRPDPGRCSFCFEKRPAAFLEHGRVATFICEQCAVKLLPGLLVDALENNMRTTVVAGNAEALLRTAKTHINMKKEVIGNA